MPKRQDIKRVLILGSGPIVIGQACEFDYSGTQACKALMAQGLEVILINSNPATIMTDPEVATRVYVEPLRWDFVEKIIEKERPQALIPTLGGQTALNLALDLYHRGILEKYQVEMLGANPVVIKKAEDRDLFRQVLDKVGAKYPKSYLVTSIDHGLDVAKELGYPIILRPNFTLGGGGGGIAYTPEDYNNMLFTALHESPTREVLVEESILGWKEYELEIMRDKAGSFVVVCNIENFDPCGVHTGDSITVAPQQTLSDTEYQEMRDEACKIINEVGVETGGANIQFAVHPTTGERVVIEMNPRVSRSSALASKATGFPIAKIAAMLSIGYTLDEIPNDITKVTPSCYEPALDYVVTKIPRFAFEKFFGSKDMLTTQMKSVGEVMGIGRTFQESLMKSLLALEFSSEGIPDITLDVDKITVPNSKRIFHLFQAFRDQTMTVDHLYELTQIHPWYLEQIKGIVDFESNLKKGDWNADLLMAAKRKGFSDARIAKLRGYPSAEAVRSDRQKWNVRPAFLQVDTCAGEFEAKTPYFYSSYWSLPEATKLSSATIAVIGSGPNRIGQGIEFDYSCVRGVKALQKQGHLVVMINSNPETVSTDYDTSDILFFEPLTQEHVDEVLKFSNSSGFVAQLGGQTPINLTHGLVRLGHKLMGSSLKSIDLSEDRGQFSEICKSLKIKIPESQIVHDYQGALNVAERIGFPVICRPNYVLGGRRMEVIYDVSELQLYFEKYASEISINHPCQVDQFLEGALEVDVDLVRGVDWSVIGGIIEHIEAAGVHSGDSMGVLPPQRLKDETRDVIEKMSLQLANKMDVIGHLNLQLAVKNDEVYVLEANPRSSRSVPFIVKAAAVPLVDLGILAMLGANKSQVQPERYNWKSIPDVAVKGVVFPFKKFAEADSLLGPEMKSTGESMGRGSDYAEALMRAFLGCHIRLPDQGEVFFSLRDKDKPQMLEVAKDLIKMGFTISATSGTAAYFEEQGLPVTFLKKVHEGRPNCVDRIRGGNISLVINTVVGKASIEASFTIRRACTNLSVPCLTETDAVVAFMMALNKTRMNKREVKPLGEHYARLI